MWKVFNNGKQTSPTSTIRKHFQSKHHHIWKSKCRHLNIPQKSTTGQTLGSSVEPFTQEGLLIQLQRFIVGDDQVCIWLFSVSPRFTQGCAVDQRD